MSAYDYLVDHARRTVWCAPQQDRQMIVKPKRLTRYGGARNTVEVLWRKLRLPEQGPRFHVFQIGQLHPALMGLFDVFDDWELLSDAMGRQNLICNVYTASGISVPVTQVWYRYTRDKNLVLALKDLSQLNIDYNTEDFFFRVYSNAYYNSSESDPLDDFIEVKGGLMNASDDIMDLQTNFGIAQARAAGGVQAYVNGRRVNAISFVTTQVGDVAEYVYDSSIYVTQEWLVSSLPDFLSTLDTKHKFLLHYAGEGSRGIDYQDDVDFFVVQPGGGSSFSGVFYHRNAIDAIRMVTHKDYSIPVAYITALAVAHDWSNPLALKVIAQIRKSGFDRPLQFENQRVQELYKMADADVKAAMVGPAATLPVWQAASLEASGYTHLMRSKLSLITRDLTEQAFGYNAISKLLGDTPKLTANVGGLQQVDVNYGLVINSTAYEYDADGLLMAWHPHVVGTVYRAADNDCALVEQIAGTVGRRLDEYYGNEPLTLSSKADWRMYRCPIVAGTPTNVFVDVTGTGNYALINGEFTWLHDTTQWFGLVRSNRISLGYTATLPVQAGNLRFSLTHEQVRNGVEQTWVMQVPMGELDIWLNGYSLIEGLDYYVQFPEIVIVNKAYLIDPGTTDQRIDIRFTGLCNADLSRQSKGDTGFVQYAMLSNNTRFDLRDDKVLRITVGGKVYDRSELLFSEVDTGVTVPDARNGAPYQVRDLVVPLRGYAVSDTYSLRAAAQVIDQQVSDYLTLKVPAPTFGSPSAITERYAVFSPFCCAILNDLASGDLDPPQMYGHFSDQDVFNICQPYEELLAFDPTQEGNEPDDEFVMIHPHNLDVVMNLNVYQYKFAMRMVNLYLHGKVSLSTFVQMT
jgi:hypothetical protein